MRILFTLSLLVVGCSPKMPDVPNMAEMQKSVSVSMGCTVAAASDHFSSFLSVNLSEAEFQTIVEALPITAKGEEVWALLGSAETARLKGLLKQSFDQKDKLDSTHAQTLEDYNGLLARGLVRLKSAKGKKESFIFNQIHTFEEDGMSASQSFKIELRISDSTKRQGYQKYNFCN